MAWYNSSWTYRKEISIDSSYVGSDLTDHPLYIDLGDANFSNLHSNCKSDGSDIVLTSSNGTTKLDRELVWINTTAGTGELYVRTNISSSSATKIYIYYGNAGASETNSTGTWRSEYKLVSHYQTNADNSTSYGTDGTSNGATLTTGGGGEIGECYSFTRSEADYLNYADDPDWDFTDALSVSCFFNADSLNFQGLVGRLRGGIRRWSTICLDTGSLRMRISGSTNYDVSAGITTGVWYLTHFTYSDSNNRIRIYTDGSQVGSDLACTESLSVGTEPITVGEEGGGDYFDGDIDEVRVYNGELGSDWISFENDNMTNFSNVATIGAQETESTPRKRHNQAIFIY